jgi:tetrahydromethanopterin S-methyltransferase subunit G
MAENESSSFQPVSSISQQQIQDIEERIAKLERRVDEMTNSQVQSTPTKPITQEDIVNVLNVTSSILGAVCILFAGLLWIDIFVISSSPNTNSANFDMSLIWFFSGLPLLMFGWFKGFSKIVTFKSEET